MPQPLYPITARGNERRDSVLDNADDERVPFLAPLSGTCERFDGLCPADCPMISPYPLLVETPDAPLAKGRRQLNGVYTQQVNRSHGRVGPLFQRRFNGILVEKDRYLLERVRSVVLNPVHAGRVRPPEEWPWSR